jgi:hypothetical protein
MPALVAGVGEAETIHDVVEAALEGNQKVGARDAFLPVRPFEKQAKLLFRKAVHPFDLLLFPELDTIVRGFSAAPLSVLSWRISPSVKGAFIRITAVSL